MKEKSNKPIFWFERLNYIKHLGNKYSYKLLREDEEYIWFINKFCYIKINYKLPVVYTTIKHPTKGLTTLRRSGLITPTIMNMIFQNPRMHLPFHIQSVYV